MPSAPDQPRTCSECRLSWTHIRFRKTGSQGAVTLCTLSNKLKDSQTTACSLAESKLLIHRAPAVPAPGP
jgi:hypothetical protein